MFDSRSRYAGLKQLTYVAPDGREVHYVSRRFLPPVEAHPTLAELEIMQDARLDLIASEALGDPLLYWRIADANHVLDPLELTRRAGRAVRIPGVTMSMMPSPQVLASLVPPRSRSRS